MTTDNDGSAGRVAPLRVTVNRTDHHGTVAERRADWDRNAAATLMLLRTYNTIDSF